MRPTARYWLLSALVTLLVFIASAVLVRPPTEVTADELWWGTPKPSLWRAPRPFFAVLDLKKGFAVRLVSYAEFVKRHELNTRRILPESALTQWAQSHPPKRDEQSPVLPSYGKDFLREKGQPDLANAINGFALVPDRWRIAGTASAIAAVVSIILGFVLTIGWRHRPTRTPMSSV